MSKEQIKKEVDFIEEEKNKIYESELFFKGVF